MIALSGRVTHEESTMIRDEIKAALITAMKSGDKETTAALRLAQSSIKNRDIEARTQAPVADDDALVVRRRQSTPPRSRLSRRRLR